MWSRSSSLVLCSSHWGVLIRHGWIPAQNAGISPLVWIHCQKCHFSSSVSTQWLQKVRTLVAVTDYAIDLILISRAENRAAQDLPCGDFVIYPIAYEDRVRTLRKYYSTDLTFPDKQFLWWFKCIYMSWDSELKAPETIAETELCFVDPVVEFTLKREGRKYQVPPASNVLLKGALQIVACKYLLWRWSSAYTVAIKLAPSTL